MKKTLRINSPNSAVIVKVADRPGVARFAKAFTIGRAPECDLVITDPSVSLRHALVELEEGSWWLRDLGSTNGTLVAGRSIERIPIEPAVQVRLGYQGPALVLAVEGLDAAEGPETVADSETAIARRYLGRRPPTTMGEVTAIVRGVIQRVQRRRMRRYVLALGLVSLLAAGAAGYAYLLHQEFERQRALAADLFYRAKDLELEVLRLELSGPERAAYRERTRELDQRYRDLVQELGIYSDDTPPEVQIVYRVAHRFGESEIDMPPEFVEEVLRYVDRWRSTPRLDRAMARAGAGNFGPRIAEIMLEHDLPPDFFYLALQESGFRLEAVGPETRFGFAKGMWQIIPGTAREYGLRTGPLVGVARHDPADQRHDFERSTRAAARYLRHIYTTDAQASGLLVIASYNWGQTNILRLIRSMPENPRERNFWQLLVSHRESLPRETYDYVFSIVSAAVIGEDPELFGFDFEPPFSRPAAGAVEAGDAP